MLRSGLPAGSANADDNDVLINRDHCVGRPFRWLDLGGPFR
jgi:hypothetical protein